MKSTPRIGAFVLDTLTTGMYTNPLDSIREFVQNSFDSIRQAERTGAIKPSEGRIELHLNLSERSIRIRDNGIGIPSDRAYETLVNIGLSDKGIAENIGFRGIGRLAGIAYCDSLYFRTLAPGDSKSVTVLMDCKGLRQAMSPAARQVEELAHVLEKNSDYESKPKGKESHFFEVELSGLSDAASCFLDWKVLEKYLIQVAPLALDAQHFTFATKIREWADKHSLSMPTVAIVIKGPLERQIFKYYKNHYRTADGNFSIGVEDVHFFPENPSANAPFWAWYAKTQLLGAIGDEQAAGFRLRKYNMGVGGAERTAELFAETAQSNARMNGYYAGEVHITAPDVIPNARRDGFEDNSTWLSIRSDLVGFFRERIKDVRKASETRNRPVVKVLKSANEVLERTSEQLSSGFVSKEQRDRFVECLQKETTKVAEALKTRKEAGERQTLQDTISKLEGLSAQIHDNKNFALKKIRTSLDRKQRKLLQRVLAILHEVLDAQNFSIAQGAILSEYEVTEDGESQ